LLSRTNAKAQGYAAALTAAGVPVVLEQPGLLATPEVNLALACLRRLVESDDTLASAEIVALKSAQPPESWLEDRLEHLAQGRSSERWGVDGALQVPALQALEALRGRLVYLSPSELLDDVLTAADLRTDAKAWGPTEPRSAQRLTNLETLRGLAVDYEEHCRTLRGSATASGLLLWLYALADRGQDVRGVASQADAVRVLTHHGAKGLEWPVVITADLETETSGRLWGATVVSDALPVDIHAPLAGRRLHYWPWPFGKQSAGIAVAARIAASPVARADQQRQRAEEIRLLYVSFTRARDVLVLPFTGNGEGLAWLDTTGANWVRPAEESLNCPGGEHIPCSTETCEALESTKPDRFDMHQPWFSAPLPRTPKLPARLNPSGQPPVDGARIGATVELGARVTLRGTVDSECLGDAVHNILATELIDPACADRREMASRVLAGYGLAAAMEVDDVLDAASRLRGHLTQTFRATRILVEWPVASELDDGQRVSGWIDVLVETNGGWVIIDHKAFPGPRADWSAKALEYSGQLATYRRAVERATARPVLSQWVHFPIGGGLVEVVLPPAG
jgi:ATP-dependent exoDNAse (exonuclease V) beta subunit